MERFLHKSPLLESPIRRRLPLHDNMSSHVRKVESRKLGATVLKRPPLYSASARRQFWHSQCQIELKRRSTRRRIRNVDELLIDVTDVASRSAFRWRDRQRNCSIRQPDWTTASSK